MPPSYIISKENRKRALALQRSYSSNYFLASFFFPKKIRAEIAVLYAFVRIPDEYVDNAASPQEANKKIDSWRKEWDSVIEGKVSDEWVLNDMYALHLQYSMPFDLSHAFLNVMKEDTTVTRYKNYAELLRYMYGSAATVGRMITYFSGVTDEPTLLQADALAYAMQITNILRDVGEDFTLRNRIYLPQDEMAQFGITEAMIAEKKVTPQWRAFMQFQIKRNRELYRQADKGIRALPPSMRYPVRTASIFYEAILSEIEKADYDVFTRKQKTSSLRKVALLFKSAFNV
ncbi:MAG: phytoene/squalene synthase family protein [Minisyncoccia bacterium]